MIDPQNDPSTRSPTIKAQAIAVERCRDVYEGPLKVRARGKEYLPQFLREPDEKYRDRLQQSVLYDFFSRTCRGLTGMVFRTPPTLAEDMPDAITAAWENIDLLGTHGRVFWHQRHLDGEIDGHFIVFVDMSERLRRPYAVGIRKDQVVDALVEDLDGVPTLTHFRYEVKQNRRAGRYGYEEVRTVREYNLREEDGARYVERIVHTQTKTPEGRSSWLAGEPAVMEIDEIPVRVGYLGDRRGPFESDPPHVALCEENLKHYNLVSDNDNVLHVCSVPQFAVIGADRKQTGGEVSPNAGWDLPAGGEIMYAEPQGNGLQAAERRIEKSEQRMAYLGLSMLYSENRGAETATSKRINKSETDSQLALHASETADAMEEVVRLMAKWLDLELPQRPEGRWVSLNTDFEAMSLDPQAIRAFAELLKMGLPWRPVLEMMLEGRRLPQNTDLDALELQILAATAAEADLQESERVAGIGAPQDAA